ncbi:MAG: hypothetical protein HY554_04170 [Elusimicrobia bacterium]|nr:hypothetical protein [Elusimicrobiota bacterium]
MRIAFLAAGLILGSWSAAASAEEKASGSAFDGAAGPSPSLPPSAEVPPVLRWVAVSPERVYSEDNAVSRDQVRFAEDLRSGVFDDICQSIPVEFGQSIGTDFIRLRGKVKRSLRRYADKTLALVDQIPLALSLGDSVEVVNLASDYGVVVHFRMKLEGESMVIRPLRRASSCKELDRLLNVFGAKTILPLSGKRIAEMEVGELWKVPAALEVSFGPGLNARFEEGAATIYAGRESRREAMLTLYRMSKDELRVRLRFQKVKSKVRGVEVRSDVEVADWIDLGSNIFGDTVAHEVTREVRKLVQAKIGLSTHKVDPAKPGTGSLLEFVVNPNDQARMEDLAQLVVKDLNLVKTFAKEALPGHQKVAALDHPEDVLEKIVASHRAMLDGESAYAGAKAFSSKGGRVPLTLPFLADLRWSWSSGQQSLTASDGSDPIHIDQVDRSRSLKAFDVPWIGHLSRHDLSQSAQLYFREDADGPGDVTAVFIRQEGFRREGAYQPRAMTAKADAIMQRVGALRSRANVSVSLPQAELFAPDPSGKPEPPGYKDGVTSFTLIFSREALRDMLAAHPQEVVSAYINSLDGEAAAFAERALIVAPKSRADRLDWGPKPELPRDARGVAITEHHQRIARQRGIAAGLVRDLAEARKARTPKAQSEAFRKLLAGEGRSGLALDDVLKVLVAFASPADVNGEFYIDVDKGGKRKDIKARYVFNPALPDAKSVAEMKRQEARFNKPSTLTD